MQDIRGGKIRVFGNGRYEIEAAMVLTWCRMLRDVFVATLIFEGRKSGD